jgi:phage/plasmid primase-like uncharacterized protein
MILPPEAIERARGVPIASVVKHLRLRRQGRELIGPCPVCGGTDRFGVHVTKGFFNCRGCKAAGDVIDLVRLLDGCDFLGAVEHLAGGIRRDRQAPAHPPPARQRGDGADARRMLDRAEAIWREAVAIDGTPGAGYLAGRGIDIREVPDHGGLRFHPCTPWEDGTTPCVVARLIDAATCKPLGVWRRPIDRRKPKAIGPASGGVVKLWDDHAVIWGSGLLVVGEGVETVLSAAVNIEHGDAPLAPAWACCFAANLANFPIVPGVERLVILADNDEADKHGRCAGQEAAALCAERWADAGRRVTILTPPAIGTDFNDLVRP